MLKAGNCSVEVGRRSSVAWREAEGMWRHSEGRLTKKVQLEVLAHENLRLAGFSTDAIPPVHNLDTGRRRMASLTPSPL
jgi:hypothetical protein